MKLVIWIIIISLVACSESNDENIADTASERPDSGDSPGVDGGSGALIRDIELEKSDAVNTVFTVRFKTETPAKGYVTFGPTEAMAYRTPKSAKLTTDHEFLLLGLPSRTTCYYQIRAETDDVSDKSRVLELETGGLPTALPSLSQTGDGHDGFIMVPLIGGINAVTIINSEGEIVWYHLDERELDTFRVRLAVDGKGVLYNAASIAGDPSDNTEIVRGSFDGSKKERLSIPLLAHDFVEHPDGTLAAIATEYRTFEGADLRGDRIVEIAPNGEETVIWTSWDCFDPNEHRGDGLETDWTFANALDYDPVRETYYVGMRNFSSIAKVPRAGGMCEWVLGNTGETLDFADGSSPFLHQHQFQVLEDSILVFDNDGSPGLTSRVIEYRLDLDAGKVVEIWRYQPDDLYSFVLGEAIRLDNGDTFINWSSKGQMNRVTSEGEVTWQLNTIGIYAFGFNTLADSLYIASEN